MRQVFARFHERLPVPYSEVVETKPNFPKAEVLRFLAGGNGGRASKKVLRNMRMWSERLQSVAKPVLAYSITGVAGISKTGVILQNGVALRSPKLARAMRGSYALVSFVGTIGDGVDNEIDRLNETGSMADAFMADALASVGAEQLIEKFHNEMDDYYQSRGEGVTLRFSPGYCDWPLDEQDKVFSLVDSDLVGVELHESRLMMPRKSVSGVFGLTRDPAARRRPHNPCAMCGKRDCTARRQL